MQAQAYHAVHAEDAPNGPATLIWPETIDVSMGAQAAARMVEPRECEHRHAIFPTRCAARACVCVFTPRCVRPDYGPGGG